MSDAMDENGAKITAQYYYNRRWRRIGRAAYPSREQADEMVRLLALHILDTSQRFKAGADEADCRAFFDAIWVAFQGGELDRRVLRSMMASRQKPLREAAMGFVQPSPCKDEEGRV